MASPGQDYVVWPQGMAFASLAKAVAYAKKHAESRYVEGSRNLKVYWRANPENKIVRDKWVNAKIKVTKAGKILAKVSPGAVSGKPKKRAPAKRVVKRAVKRATPKRKAKRY